MPEHFLDSETVLARFNRLLQDLLRGTIRRNTFLPWEVDLMLDIEQCALTDRALRRELQRYQVLVRKRMAKGECTPPRFREFLKARSGVTTPVSAAE